MRTNRSKWTKFKCFYAITVGFMMANDFVEIVSANNETIALIFDNVDVFFNMVITCMLFDTFRKLATIARKNASI
jgi:hypothetical protein